uniref:Aminopeptidase N-like N-terminal domain-containing protein n=1 Tax=Kalanchoe fedtschenkoi TaxID=63787 RepID=A0A7N0V5C6_KALFE
MGFGRRQSICWAVLLVFSCFELTLGNPVPEDYGTGAENFTGQLQLPKFAVPSRYELRLKPDLVGFTFSGSVNIELDIVSETKFLVYNAVELTILLGDISFNSSKSDKACVYFH